MTMWILIFWLNMYQGGGPATATFETEQACHAAAQAIKNALSSGQQWREYSDTTIFRDGRTYKPYVCVPNR